MSCCNGDHCWHISTKPIMMVVPDGHVVVACCHCQTTRTMHYDHFREGPKQLHPSEGRAVPRRYTWQAQ